MYLPCQVGCSGAALGRVPHRAPPPLAGPRDHMAVLCRCELLHRQRLVQPAAGRGGYARTGAGHPPRDGGRAARLVGAAGGVARDDPRGGRRRRPAVTPPPTPARGLPSSLSELWKILTAAPPGRTHVTPHSSAARAHRSSTLMLAPQNSTKSGTRGPSYSTAHLPAPGGLPVVRGLSCRWQSMRR